MKKSVLVSLFILLNFQIFPQIAQGSVLINSFDPEIGGGHYDIEMVVLVNRTSSSINLNGYEILCYNFNAIAHLPAFWQFTGSYSYILPPYKFVLLTRNTNNVSGISGDLVRNESGGEIDYDGYLALKKINATSPSDFIDIVKYSQYTYPPTNPQYQFTAVPANSGISMFMPGVAFNTGPESYLTRGGVSGNINSIHFTNYGMVGQSISDFFEVPQTNATYIENSGFPPLPVELSGFSADVLSRIGILPEPEDILHTIFGVGGSEVVFTRKIDELKAGTYSLKQFEIEIGSMDYGLDIHGILGMDFLISAGARIDLEKLEMTFTKSK